MLLVSAQCATRYAEADAALDGGARRRWQVDFDAYGRARKMLLVSHNNQASPASSERVTAPAAASLAHRCCRRLQRREGRAAKWTPPKHLSRAPLQPSKRGVHQGEMLRDRPWWVKRWRSKEEVAVAAGSQDGGVTRWIGNSTAFVTNNFLKKVKFSVKFCPTFKNPLVQAQSLSGLNRSFFY